jgi:ribosomal protein S18 acetylase RimI-like enzyme
VTFQDAAVPWYRHASWRFARRGLPPLAALRASLFLAAFHSADFPGTELYLETMAVHPDARGKGVGSALLELAEDEARRRGRSSVCLYCLTNNTRARALYERAGYRFVHREDLWWCAPVLGFRFTDLLRKHLGQPAGTSFSKNGCAPGSAVMPTEP